MAWQIAGTRYENSKLLKKSASTLLSNSNNDAAMKLEYYNCRTSGDKHIYPFNDHLVIYVRYLGPGVLVGQAWQEGKKLEQVPRKLCDDILMVKDYTLLQDQ
ncbi:unnamed protein product [Lupinus luteus]|uniref:Uncharacterized protein n=1 Tax=Lupinus luteus TaxID=3873 RepID=A0AAV1WH18_LUPLU